MICRVLVSVLLFSIFTFRLGLCQEVENQFEFGIEGDTFSIIYTVFYGVVLLSIFIYVLRLKKQLGYEENIFLLLWSLEEVIFAPVLHIVDTASDVGVLIVFYTDMRQQWLDNDDDRFGGINMTIFFIAAMLIFTFYRIKSGVDVYRVTHKWWRGLMQILFDSELFFIVYVNLAIGETEPIGLLKYYRGEEALFESTLQCVLQFVYLISREAYINAEGQKSDVDIVIFISFIMSLESILGYGAEIDGQNLTERATHEFTWEEACCRGDYCCCNVKNPCKAQKRRGTLTEQLEKTQEVELQAQAQGPVQPPAGVTTIPSVSPVTSVSHISDDAPPQAPEAERGDLCFGQIYSEWLIAWAWRHLDAVSQVFILSLVWCVMGFYWFVFVMIVTLFALFLIIHKAANAWA